MGYSKSKHELDCPKCGARLEATIEEAGYGPANEWISEDCPACGEQAISKECCIINLRVIAE